MAQSYIGKIAGIVTLNTRGVTKGVDEAKAELKSLEPAIKSVIRSMTASADKAFDSIYTPLQRLRQALKAASRDADLKLVPPDEAKRIAAMAKAAEQIFEPLAKGTAEFGKLSRSAQGEFLPALKRAQAAALSVNQTISETGSIGASSYSRVQRQVEKTAAALQRLSEAQQIANRGPRGTELAFAAPAVNEALNASVTTRQNVAALPAGKLTADIVKQVQNLAALDDKIVATQAKVDAIVLRPKVDSSKLAAARNELDDYLAAQQRVRNQLDNSVSEEGRLREQAAARQIAINDALAADEKKRLDDRAATEKQIDDALEARQRARENKAASSAAKRKQIDANLNRAASERQQLIGIDFDDPTRQLGVLSSKLSSVKGDLDQLPTSLRARFIPAIREAEQEMLRLAANGVKATSSEIEKASRRLDGLAKTAKRFGDATGLRSFKTVLEDTASQRAIGEFKALEQVVVRLGTAAGGPVAGAFQRLRAATQKAVAEGTTGVPAVRAQLDRLQKSAALAAASTGKISLRNALQQIQRGGDIATKGFGNIGLASQQALFAVDDFFSVTGDASQRIRAMGNNLTQLGVILGGTKGLLLTLGAVLATQAVVQIAKWISSTTSAKDTAEALTEAIKAQKTALDDVRKSFAELTSNTISNAFDDATDKTRGLRREFAGLVSDFERANKNRKIEFDPDVLRQSARLASADRRLEEAAEGGAGAKEIQALLRERRAAENALSNARRTAREGVSGRGIRGEVNIRDVADFSIRASEILSGFQEIANQAIEQGTPGAREFSRTIGDFQERLKNAADNLKASEDTDRSFGERTIARKTAEAQIGIALRDLEGDLIPLAGTVSNATESLKQFNAAIKQAEGVLDTVIGRESSSIIDDLLGRAGSSSEQARREANQAAARAALGIGTREDLAFAQDRQRRAETVLGGVKAAAATQRQVEDGVRKAFLGSQQGQDLASELARATRIAGDEAQPFAVRANAAEEARRIQAQIEQVVASTPAVAAARKRADAIDVASQKEFEREQLRARGRELQLTNGQRVGAQLAIDEAAVRAAGGPDADKAISRIREEAFRGLAPTLFGLQDQVQNAIRLGPSRAALNPTDVSTVEGSRELTRLLRGDDAARNQDLVAIGREGNEILRAIEKKLELENAN